MINKIFTNSVIVFAIATLGACSSVGNIVHKLTPDQQRESDIAFYAAPSFPDEAAKNCQAGTVLVQYDVDYTGDVKPDSVRVLADAGSQALADAAVAAVRQWKYEPAMDGTALVERTGLQTEVNFEIEGCDPSQ